MTPLQAPLRAVFARLARRRFAFGLAALIGLTAVQARAEDGYDLWLRYRPLPDAQRGLDLPHAAEIVTESTGSPTLAAARTELTRGLGGLLATPPTTGARLDRDGGVLIGSPASSPTIARLDLGLDRVGPEGYVIRSLVLDGRPTTVIAGRRDIGALYGAFHFLRLVQTGEAIDHLDLASSPRIALRVLDHWDNLDRTVERGYAGQSLWDWRTLPDWRDPRYADYARADASIGINGAVLNNVNASAASLTAPYLQRAAVLADIFRPYGVRVYLSARFSAPIEIGGLATADPLDPRVKAWWRGKADEIYRLIPDFGGFLVKANSEGQPGPQDYGRSHVDGANMLADALAPHGGVVMWRAFVYAKEVPDDRAKQAYAEFTPLDGRFRDNVIVQVKNGPIDFQPREPVHPLFGAMPKTPLMMEFQITKEYLGFATHLVYLGPLYEEALRTDTEARGPGSTVARVIDGTLDGHRLSGMAGVANVGTDRDWCGSQFDQANWYVFGRMAWDPDVSAREVARDWARMTFSSQPRVVEPVVEMMMGSRQAAVDYMTPLGLHHVMARDTHYGPGPWVAGGPRADWTATYYHRADAKGIGFDRTSTGSDAVAQYAPAVAARFERLDQTPEDLLLWFHHVPWTYRTRSGRSLWDELVFRYGRGVATVEAMQATWASLAGDIDAERHSQVAAFLAIQAREARWWRDASLAYFQSLSKSPFPPGYVAPPRSLADYESSSLP